MQEKNEQKKESKIPIKFTKNNCLILVLMGILLLVIVWPVGDNSKTLSKQSMPMEQFSTTTGLFDEKSIITGENENAIPETDSMREYAAYLESALEELLSTVEGAGEIKVMITMESSQEAVVEKDKTLVRAGTTEVDSAGGSRNTSDISDSEETLYVGGRNNGELPYVKKIIAPRIAGVVVSAQGAGKESVVKNITEAIQVLFGIDAHKIKIVKMISK